MKNFFFALGAVCVFISFAFEAGASVELYTWKDTDGSVAYSIIKSSAHPKKNA